MYVIDCTFRYNSVSGWGGAIFSEDRDSQTSGTFPRVRKSDFLYNYAGIHGGAICFYNGVVGLLEDNNFYFNTANNKAEEEKERLIQERRKLQKELQSLKGLLKLKKRETCWMRLKKQFMNVNHILN